MTPSRCLIVYICMYCKNKVPDKGNCIKQILKKKFDSYVFLLSFIYQCKYVVAISEHFMSLGVFFVVVFQCYKIWPLQGILMIYVLQLKAQGAQCA